MTPSLLQGSLMTAVVVGVCAVLLHTGVPGGMASTAAFVAVVGAKAALILPSRTARVDWRSLALGSTPVSRWVLACTLLALYHDARTFNTPIDRQALRELRRTTGLKGWPRAHVMCLGALCDVVPASPGW